MFDRKSIVKEKKFKSKISHQIWNFQSRAQTVNFTSLEIESWPGKEGLSVVDQIETSNHIWDKLGLSKKCNMGVVLPASTAKLVNRCLGPPWRNDLVAAIWWLFDCIK